MANYMIAQLDEVEPVDCPCGAARRAFAVPDNPTATMHLVDISADSKAHYHKKMTEIYLVLAGRGEIELDGETFPLAPMTARLPLLVRLSMAPVIGSVSTNCHIRPS